MAASPSFIGTPRIASVNVTAANTAVDGTGTIAELIRGVAAGTRILEVTAKQVDDAASSKVNLFLSLDSGTTWRLLDGLELATLGGSDTVDTASVSITFDNLVLVGTGHRLGVTSTVAQSTNVFAFGGDL